MRKILFGIFIMVIILITLYGIRTLAVGLLYRATAIERKVIGEVIYLMPVSDLSIMQGDSGQALTIINNTIQTVKFNLGHAHGHLTFVPENDTLAPGASRDITIAVDDFCPSGEVSMLVFLMAETETENFGMDTTEFTFTVLPGDLVIKGQDGQIIILWKDNPAPPGVILYYRDPYGEDQSWKFWGETPSLYPPANLKKGTYSFEFKAGLSNVESNVELLEIFVEGSSEP